MIDFHVPHPTTGGVFEFSPKPNGPMSIQMTRAFSIIELLFVIAIIGIISAIAVSKAADASSGRRFMAAERRLLSDVENTQLRARAKSKSHLIQFYPDHNKYIIFEGLDANRDSIVHSMDFDDSPFTMGISSTSLSGDQYAVITPLGVITPGFTVTLSDQTLSRIVTIGGEDLGVIDVKLTMATQDVINTKTTQDLFVK